MHLGNEQVINIDVLPSQCKSNLRWNGFYSEKHSLFYTATPKAACTTFKWWFADLVEKADAVRTVGGSLESSPELIIHDRFWRVAPDLTHLDAIAIARVLQQSDTFSFCLVRNPFTRIFSAWQSKWLLQEPLQIGPYKNCEFLDLPVTSAAEVALAFEAFLEHIFSSEFPRIADLHVLAQKDLLCTDQMAYRMVGRMEAPEPMCHRLIEHLGAAYKNPFSFAKRNESLIPYDEALITARSEQLIRDMYAADFESFGYDRKKPPTQSALTPGETQIALKAVSLLRGRHQRIGEMRQEYQTALNIFQQQLSLKQKDAERAMQNASDFEGQSKLFRQEMVRAEAQLALMKELWLNEGKHDSL